MCDVSTLKMYGPLSCLELTTQAGVSPKDLAASALRAACATIPYFYVGSETQAQVLVLERLALYCPSPLPVYLTWDVGHR